MKYRKLEKCFSIYKIFDNIIDINLISLPFLTLSQELENKIGKSSQRILFTDD